MYLSPSTEAWKNTVGALRKEHHALQCVVHRERVVCSLAEVKGPQGCRKHIERTKGEPTCQSSHQPRISQTRVPERIVLCQQTPMKHLQK